MGEDVYWKKYSERFKTFAPLIEEDEDLSLKLIICIPVCAEPELLKTMASLLSCNPVSFEVEVILLFNKNIFMSPDEIDLHDEMWIKCNDWISENKNDHIKFHS